MAWARATWRDSSSRGNRGASRPSSPVGASRTARSWERSGSIPLQRSLLPHVDVADEQYRYEHEHLTETEKGEMRHGTGAVHESDVARELAVVGRPGDHEHRLD